MTIEDVARLANVSISTVSNALNGKAERMRPETRLRIEAAVSGLGYRPNHAARQLKTGHAPILGLLVPSVANPAYGMLTREVEIAAQEQHGYKVLLGNTYRSREREASYFDDFVSHGVRGIILISSLEEQEHVDAAVRRGLVAVSYDRRAPKEPLPTIDYVSMNNFKAAALATQHLIDHGHTRLALVTAAGRTLSRAEKIEGFNATAAGAVSAIVIEGRASTAYGDSEMLELGRVLAAEIVRMRRRPTGVVAINDLLAFGLIGEFRKQGLSVPEDISIVGIDDLFISPLFTPALTSIRPPLEEMARTMVDCVVSRILDSKRVPAEFLFDPTLIARDSVRSYRRSRR